MTPPRAGLPGHPHLDIVVGETPREDGVPGGPSAGGPVGRPSIQVYFSCSNAYLRVFRAVDGSGYQARCPRCGKDIRFAVGPGGTSQRFFTLSC